MINAVEIHWHAANGDPSKFSDEGVREREKVTNAMREASLRYTYPNPVMAFDGVDLSFTTIITGPLGTTALGALSAIAGIFLQARLGRKVRIKVGNIEAEAGSAEEVERLLAKAIDAHNQLKMADVRQAQIARDAAQDQSVREINGKLDQLIAKETAQK